MTQIPVSKGCYRLLSGICLLFSLAMVVQGGDMAVIGLVSSAICGWAFFSTFKYPCLVYSASSWFFCSRHR